jgi:hypothetical protein
MANYTFETVAVGANLFNGYNVGIGTPDTLQLKLYTNDATITSATVVGDLTECVDGGYSAYALTPGSWTVTWSTDRSIATFTVDNTITFAGTTSIYGAYITNAAGTILIGVADFGTVKSYDAADELVFTEGSFGIKPV